MEPLSISASVAGLISLGIQVTGKLVAYYTSYRRHSKEITRITDQLESLGITLGVLRETFQLRKFRSDEQTLLKNIESEILQCEELIRELQQDCDKLATSSPEGFRTSLRQAGRLAYPFRESTLKKIEENIGGIQASLSLALQALQIQSLDHADVSLADVTSLVESIRVTQLSSEIRDWLKAPDATIYHNAACAKRHSGTGLWFVNGSIFREWLAQEPACLWLSGLSGCGKSILCSTAIQYALRHKRSNTNVGVAFFYFSFGEEATQVASAMLRALLSQLSSQRSDAAADLQLLHKQYENSTPPIVALLDCLRTMLQRYQQAYLLLDALDESPRYEKREHVLQALHSIQEWSLTHLHLLVTARDEPDIRESLQWHSVQELVVKGGAVDQDIHRYISGRLQNDPQLLKWKQHHDHIVDTLIQRAGGSFRWVECQFEALKRSPRSEAHLERCLQSLPRTLDETYERMLRNIDESYREEARRILTFLCSSRRPLTVQELCDAVAIDLNSEPRACFDHRLRLQGGDDLHEICPGLIDIFLAERKTDRTLRMRGVENDNLVPTVRIAHFSVQEYLESPRIHQQKAACFSLQKERAHAEIAKCCIAYLLEPDLHSGQLSKTVFEGFPLARFAAESWLYHAQQCESRGSQLDDLIMYLFETPTAFRAWVQIHDFDTPGPLEKRKAPTGSPMYYAALLGLLPVVDRLGTRVDVNAPSGWYGNALQAAAAKGHEEISRVLIENGANINAKGNFVNPSGRRIWTGGPLNAAVAGGHTKVIELLIERGADLHADSYRYYSYGKDTKRKRRDRYKTGAIREPPLFHATRQGNSAIVQLLLENGADVNCASRSEISTRGSTSNFDSTASYPLLPVAAALGNLNIVRELLERGAFVESRTELKIYSRQGLSSSLTTDDSEEKESDKILKSTIIRTSLEQAVIHGHTEIVGELLRRRADTNRRCRDFDNLLGAASSLVGGYDIVHLLLASDVDWTVRSGTEGESILLKAIGDGDTGMVKTFLEHGVEIDERDLALMADYSVDNEMMALLKAYLPGSFPPQRTCSHCGVVSCMTVLGNPANGNCLVATSNNTLQSTCERT